MVGEGIVEDSDFYPFGGERVFTDTLADQNYKFTSKERDYESASQLDYFVARHYAWRLGRFLQPDEFEGGPVDAFSANDPLPPGPLPYADITNPQSLNKYTYVWNNPLEYTDPDGHQQQGVAAPPTTPTKVPVSTTIRVIMLTEGKAAPGAGAGALVTGLAFGLVGAAGLAAYSSFELTRAQIAQEALFAEVGQQNKQKLAQQQQEQGEQGSPTPEPAADGAGARKGSGGGIREDKVQKQLEVVSQYSDAAIGRSIRKAESRIRKHEELLKRSPQSAHRSINRDIQNAREQLEALRREQARRLRLRQQ